jgi:hypothetical protein
MSEKYYQLRAVYVEAKQEYYRLETELAVARAKMRAAERAAITKWRNLTDPERFDACKAVALSSAPRESL